MKRSLFLFMTLLAGIVNACAQSVSLSITTQPCVANGVLTATCTAMTPPLTFTYYGGAGNINLNVTHAGVVGLSDQLTNWVGGSVTVYVIDANNTFAYDTISSAFRYSTTVAAGLCPNPDTLTATIMGGTAPFTYQWIPYGSSTAASTTNPGYVTDGQYNFTVTDANGCIRSYPYGSDSLFAYSTNNITYMVNSSPANCTNGTATVSAISGGTAPYAIMWSNNATTLAQSNLMMGSYSFTITDANGCQSQGSAYISQTVIINANAVVTNATCLQSNGSIAAFPSGGSAPYTYVWSNNATTSSINNLATGSYSVMVRDANNCIGFDYPYVNATTPITATYTTTHSSCTSATGSATLTLNGGQAPYTIVWNTYPAQSGLTATGLPPGNYGFHVTDANGCVQTGTVVIPGATSLYANISQLAAPMCLQANGTLQVTVSGNAPPYTYAWSNGPTTATNSNIAAGNYTITVTDDSGCKKILSTYLASFSPVVVNLYPSASSCIFTADGSITSNISGGTAPYTYAWSNGSTTANLSNLLQGFYYVSVHDANGCQSYQQTNVAYNASNNSCYCTIQGTVYNDMNQNCTQDPGELGIQNIQVHCSSNGYGYTNANGFYSFIVPAGTFTVSQTVQTVYPLAPCQNNNNVLTSNPYAGCILTQNFADTVIPVHDIQVDLWDNTMPVPGFNYTQTLLVTNNGTVTENGPMASYLSDGQLASPNIVSSVVFTGSGNYYTLPSGNLTLSPGQTQASYIHYAIPTNIPLATALVYKDTATYTSPMSNWLNDYTPWDNVCYHTTYVVGPYDPNFKEVNPQGYGPTGIINYGDSVLEYMVHFQNVGSYPAQNVVVLDTIDANLDITTLKPIYQTAPCKVTINENRVAKFSFDNIYLQAAPYSNTTLGSTGMFTYSIHTKSGLPLGTQFHNSASIYFDRNAPVKTNVTVNTLGNTAGIKNLTQSNGMAIFGVYPNPATNTVYLQFDNANDRTAQLYISDLAGKTVYTQSLQLEKGKQQFTLNTTNLVPGIYFINAQAADMKFGTQKLVIVK